MKSKRSLLIILFSLFLLIHGKLNAQAPNWVWAKSMVGADYQRSSSISLDAAGNIYTSGWFAGTVDFDPGVDTFDLIACGYQNAFISKSDSSGNFVWVNETCGTGYSNGISLTNDSLGNVYTTGYFDGIVDFDFGAGIFNLTAAGQRDIFICKIDSFGNLIWVK